MHKATVDPRTGYIESRNPAQTGFTASKKVKFVSLAREMADRGQMPNVPALCKAVGIDNTTWYWHLQRDARLKTDWDAALDLIEANLVDTMVAQGQTPRGYMDRITWLRAYRPGRWNPEREVKVSHNFHGHKTLVDALSGAIDADIVEIPSDTGTQSPKLESIEDQSD